MNRQSLFQIQDPYLGPQDHALKVDSLFQTNRYNFMARGGEVYYLHILSALNNNPQYKEEIEKGFNILINHLK